MKYIITETQHAENIEYIKPLAFKYWTKYGPKEFDVDKVMGVFSIPNTNRNIGMVNEWLWEWYGGNEGITKMLSKYEGQVFRGVEGTYNFKFFVKGISIYAHGDVEIYFDKAVIDGDGELYVEYEDEILTSVYKALSYNDDVGWEIEDEIRGIVVETLEKIIDIDFPINVDSIVFTEPKRFNKLVGRNFKT